MGEIFIFFIFFIVEVIDFFFDVFNKYFDGFGFGGR